MSSRRTSSRALERGVLAAGLASALALGWTAWRTGADVGARGELAAAELVREAAELVVAEWRALLAEPNPPAPPRGRSFEWTSGEPASRSPRERVDRAPETREPGTLDLILAEAERLERDPRTLPEAFTLLREALERIPDSPARPEAWLRSIQLARLAGDCDAAARAWRSARSEIGTEVVRRDTSYHLLVALAAADCLEAQERASLQLELADRWASGELALPGDAAELVGPATSGDAPEQGWQLAVPAARVALWRRIEALAPAPDVVALEASWRAGERLRSLRALARELGDLPQPPDGGGWSIAGSQAAPFVYRRAGPERGVRGFFVDPQLLEDAFARRVELPAGFVLDTSRDGRGEGALVRERTALAGPLFGFRLRHRDRASLVRAEVGRLYVQRAALVALALLTLGASFFAARAIRRERALAELKSAFVAGVSHDLRTPLASILLLAENLEGGSVDAEAARERYYPAIRREAARLRRLVDDALDFARLERGEAVRVAREACDLEALAGELRAEAAERVAAAGGTLAFTQSGMHGEGLLDGFALRRALWNLIDNALEHSGCAEVSLQLERSGDELVIAVGDRGRGVSPEHAERIFDPWTSFGSGNGSAPGRAGLGLAIVRAIARAHDGEARVSAGADGRGASFELRVPLDDEPSRARGREQ